MQQTDKNKITVFLTGKYFRYKGEQVNNLVYCFNLICCSAWGWLDQIDFLSNSIASNEEGGNIFISGLKPLTIVLC